MSASDLTVIQPQPRVEPPAQSGEWLRAARQARILSWLSLAWMGAEGAIGVTAGLLAGSIALIGFGIDSAIEGLASIIHRLALHRLAPPLPSGRGEGAKTRRDPVLPARAVRDCGGDPTSS